jgi:hypothetical protein
MMVVVWVCVVVGVVGMGVVVMGWVMLHLSGVGARVFDHLFRYAALQTGFHIVIGI